MGTRYRAMTTLTASAQKQEARTGGMRKTVGLRLTQITSTENAGW